ncbi:YdcF family protein [Sphingomonas sp. PL-96]|uniref:YdcF family protein n=1 Tax=Sphingomonas sp. PL-96 TaxID=2887201 RepID=UPI001E41973B|nr:YdcF family protein [Sphingomonas sp. PL-96]MCC2975777.1 YdcF family protein [Sphingomonas sp. PL-96]
MRRNGIRRVAGGLAALLAAWLVLVAVQIVRAGNTTPTRPADAAIVLGAAIRGDQPSPVFAARIDHGLTLYRRGRVRTLILTGGYGTGLRHAESAVARDYAIRRGIPASAIRIETRSRTTRENLIEAAALLRANQEHSALIVSDPLHLKRAVRMAVDLGIAAQGAPTPTTRHRGWQARAGFLLREVYYYNQYLVTGA